MKKRGNYFLILGSALILSGSVAGGLAATILSYNETHHWNINPYQKYDFNKARNSLLEAKIPEDLVSEYLDLTKKITGVKETNETIKAAELLTLDNKIMNSISQRMIWNSESPLEVQSKINLTRPILTQFYEYYENVYIYQNDLHNDSLNNMQLKSANTDLYKWSIGSNISNYSLIKDYLESAQQAWISKMSLSYIFQTFLNKKTVLYHSLVDEANDEIVSVQKQIQQKLGESNQLLNQKIEAQNQKILVGNTLAAINSWETQLDWWYGGTIAASILQISFVWLSVVCWILTIATLALSDNYTRVEAEANKDLGLRMGDIQERIHEKMGKWDNASELALAIDVIIYTGEKILENGLMKALDLLSKIAGIIISCASIVLLSEDFYEQKKMFADAKTKVGNDDSDVSNAINNFITSVDNQINDISIIVNTLNARQTNYMNQKISFNNKLNDLINHNQFLKDFDVMNDNSFTKTNIFTLDQIKTWQKDVEKKYGYLTEKSATTEDFIKAFETEQNNFNSKNITAQNKEKKFMDEYSNNDKEYFIKSLLVYVNNPLNNNSIYFNNLDILWNNYDDTFRK